MNKLRDKLICAINNAPEDLSARDVCRKSTTVNSVERNLELASLVADGVLAVEKVNGTTMYSIKQLPVDFIGKDGPKGIDVVDEKMFGNKEKGRANKNIGGYDSISICNLYCMFRDRNWEPQPLVRLRDSAGGCLTYEAHLKFLLKLKDDGIVTVAGIGKDGYELYAWRNKTSVSLGRMDT